MIKMIKSIIIEFCELNEKFDVIINGIYTGKYYTIEEAIKALPRDIEMVKNKMRMEDKR